MLAPPPPVRPRHVATTTEVLEAQGECTPPEPGTPEKEKPEPPPIVQTWAVEDLKLEIAGQAQTVRSYWWPPKASQWPQAGIPADGFDTVLLLLHGAGDAGLVWAPVANSLAKDERLKGTAVVSMDLRGHGPVGPTSTNSAAVDFQITTLVGDVVAVIHEVSRRMGGVALVLAGHSLGGALAARAAAEALRQHPPLPVQAALLLDAVEGTALDNLAEAAAWLRKRPTSFTSAEQAVAWALSSGMLSNEAVAKMTIPARLTLVPAQGGADLPGSWHWTAQIATAEQDWTGWFAGLSDLFVHLPLPKLLVVGGVERLDVALEAAHMQGRFRLEIVPLSGHQVHEDRPKEVSEAFARFLHGLRRQQAAFAKLRSPSLSPSPSPCRPAPLEQGDAKRSRLAPCHIDSS